MSGSCYECEYCKMVNKAYCCIEDKIRPYPVKDLDMSKDCTDFIPHDSHYKLDRILGLV